MARIRMKRAGELISYLDGWIVVVNRNNVPWYDARIPRRAHRCKAQTSGWHGLVQIERCACGAVRDVYRGSWSSWVWKNTRRTTKFDPTPL